MSQTPETVVSPEAATDYRQAWQTVTLWMEQGQSWSGRERNCMFLNVRDGSFADVSYATGMDWIDDGRGLALADWDHDGDIDIWLTNRTAPRIRLLRNDAPPSDFVQVKLQGTNSNRDGIGARVSLFASGESLPLTQTLRGGEGYLSQSSKWIHFGWQPRQQGTEQSPSTDESSEPLSQNVQIEVLWPSGTRDTYSIPEINRRYVLTEGSADAQALPRRALVELQPSDAQVPPPTDTAQTLLAAPYPMRRLEYVDLDGMQQRVTDRQARGYLVNLWASWCLPCVAEIKEFEESREEWEASNISVVLLSLDGVGADTTDPETTSELLERLHVTQRSGRASEELLTYLQEVNDELFGYKRALPVPTSLLLNGEGDLIGLYKGPVSPQRVIDDVARSEQSYVSLRNEVMPLDDGKWFDPPSSIRAAIYRRLADEAAARGDRQVALDAMHQIVMERPDHPVSHWEYAKMCAQLGETDQAEESCREAIALDPSEPTGARLLLAKILLQRGAVSSARTELTPWVTARPTNAEGQDLWGVLQARDGNRHAAAEAFAAAVAAAPQIAQYRHNWARALESLGDDDAAIEQYESALQLKPNATDTIAQLAWLYAASNATRRDGKRAVTLATRLVRELGQRDSRTLDLLAAALAESGDWDRAIAFADQARQAALPSDPQLAKEIEQRSNGYRKHRPYRLPDRSR